MLAIIYLVHFNGIQILFQSTYFTATNEKKIIISEKLYAEESILKGKMTHVITFQKR